MFYKYCTFFTIITLLLTSCSVKKFKNLGYHAPQVDQAAVPTLNVFTKHKKTDSLQAVLIFVYGGYWNSGRKEIYNYVGRNFARHDITIVIPDYTKSPVSSYKEMTEQIAQAIKWTKQNIKTYGGDPNQIFITGHSAGAHLAALAVMDPQYNVFKNSVKGIILNDAGGLNMYSYLKKNPPTEEYNYISTWTRDPETWKKASPLFYIDRNTPKVKIYLGTKTYPSIISGTKEFLTKLQKVQPNASINYLNKKHVPMVTQLFFPWNGTIDEIIDFMNE